jgi:hypothetical protein
MNVLAAMAALAITLGVGSAAEVWELPDTAPATNFVESAAPVDVAVEAIADAACVVVPIYHEAVETSSGTYDWIYTDASAWEQSGDWSSYTFQADVVGDFLVVGFDQQGEYSADMDLRSIDVSDVDEVTICR